MKITSEDIKKGILFTFKDIVYYEDGKSGLIPEPQGKVVVGILKEDFFLDMNTNQIYELLFFDKEGVCTFIPEIGKPYIYGIGTYLFRSKEEEQTLLETAKKALEICEEKENMISFEKRKRNRKNRGWRQ